MWREITSLKTRRFYCTAATALHDNSLKNKQFINSLWYTMNYGASQPTAGAFLRFM